MMNSNLDAGIALETWLQKATRHLSSASASQVRTEIQEHYEWAREAAMSTGATASEADQRAVMALGDAKAANRQYRRVLLTSAEAKMLRSGNCEARAFCSLAWLKWLLLALPVVALLAAAAFFLSNAMDEARVLLATGLAMGLFFIAPFLPIYTPRRGRVYRCVKWVVLTGALVLAFGPDALPSFWLLASCAWPVVWIEWTRVSLRRKLPVAKWPKQLYL